MLRSNGISSSGISPRGDSSEILRKSTSNFNLKNLARISMSQMIITVRNLMIWKLKHINSKDSWNKSWFLNKTWCLKLEKVNIMLLYHSHLSFWIKRKDSPLDRKKLKQWYMKKRESKKKLLHSNTKLLRYQSMSKKEDIKGFKKHLLKGQKRIRDSQSPKSRQLRLHSNSMREMLSRLSLSKRMPSYQITWDSLSHLELVRFHGKCWFHFTKEWLRMVNRQERNVSRRMLKLLCLFQSFHQEWSSMKRRELRRLRNKLRWSNPNLSVSDLLFQSRFPTLRDSIENSIKRWRGTNKLKS